MLSFIIKNPTSDIKSYASGTVTVAAEGQLSVAVKYWYALLNDLEFKKDLRYNNVLVNDGVEDLSYPASQAYLESVNLLGIANKDSDGSFINRAKATTTGWHFQISSIEIVTSTSFHHMNINPVTLIETPSGHVTFKLYDANRALITDPLLNLTAKYTVVDWQTDHEMEIVGAIFSQSAPPETDIYMYTAGAPGILNVAFGVGGLNLKCVGVGGIIDADGKAAKYLHHSLPIPGLNKMRTVFVHDPGTAHKCQLIYKLFRPTPGT